MALCLYLHKIFIYKEQIDENLLSANELCNVNILTEYIALLHAPYFLQTPLASAAPRIDCDFWVNLNKYQSLFDISKIDGIRGSQEVDTIGSMVPNRGVS